MLTNTDERLKDFTKKAIVKFTDEAGGSPHEFVRQLERRYNLDELEHCDDIYFLALLDYFENKVVPHKIEVYRAGVELLHQPWTRQLGVDPVTFIDTLWVHDLSKFSPAEAFGYALHDFKNPTTKTTAEFEKAWHHHKMNNPHHPEYWLNPNRSGELEVMEMPKLYLLEMVADWIGAGKTYGSTLEQWLPDNLPKFKLHPATAKDLGFVLGKIGLPTRQKDGKLFTL